MSDSEKLERGTIIQDTYEIISFLGEGGMGATYKARHVAMGHEVCVKVIHTQFLNNKRALELFKREANLLRNISQGASNDAIVKIETLLRDKSGAYYLIMEFVDGKPLSYYTSKGARLQDEDLEKFAERMLGALQMVHALNIVHRDISPDNIMVPEENILRSKLLDFGVASDAVGTEKSILGDSFAGKIGYASPEQLGLFGGDVTFKSDYYSLGLVLLHSAGIIPPGKGSMATAVEARKEDISLEKTKISKPLQKKLEALLRADPSKREILFDMQVLPQEQRPGKMKSESLTPVLVVASVIVVGTIASIALLDEKSTIETSKVTQTTGAALPPPSTTTAATTPKADLPAKPASAPSPVMPGNNGVERALSYIDLGGKSNLLAATEELEHVMADLRVNRQLRAQAAFMLARMHDPKYHSSKVSPFDRPDISRAIELYKTARQLGAGYTQPDINRLTRN